MTMTLLLDRRNKRLSDGAGRLFDPAARRWRQPEPGADPDSGPGDDQDTESMTALAAVTWLQTESGQAFRVPVGVVGPRTPNRTQEETAEVLGLGLAQMGLVVLCGGREGVMEAVCKGVADGGGTSVGLLPDEAWSAANPYVSLPLATGLGVARNAVIARAAFCLVAVGGGYGTTSEIAFALQFGRSVFGLAEAPALPGVIQLDSVEAALSAVAQCLLNCS
jgi:hypothetical protein